MVGHSSQKCGGLLNNDAASQAGAKLASSGPLQAALTVLVILACILSCTLILSVPTRSIDAATVYRGF